MKESSRRVNEYRKANCDQVSILVAKGGRKLFHVLALREGIPLAEFVRRAVLSRSGLNLMPRPKDTEGIESIRTPAEADAAVLQLQAKEDHSQAAQKKIAGAGPENDDMRFTASFSETDAAAVVEMAEVLRLLLAMKKREPKTLLQSTLTGKEVRALRRVLANITPIDIRAE